ncbi:MULTISPECIES: hypothetical protein [Brevibacillus]|uniref:hypothetical protein n=1 Tax=Brevibacillus TaxID=55080 RepID=UPI00156AA733|nr:MULTISPECIES: hypothetical protein [Brevibacillus]MDR5002236.1 hypothetical protein [Brevibacillus parabrevis]MED2256293.1 hypothetical protein [Brevibacillus parabrevis]NRQ53123.1 hypothetical protein [Brevibacillus sp. HD1.4A]WDV96969.1 hypothetical protein PSE45_08440 [Brevibacillus parabrevis]
MFYHGIKWEYVRKEYPLLSPRRIAGKNGKAQCMDRLHLLQQFGLEPVHLLEADESYPDERCIAECLAFGDTVFAFERLSLPMWQLSRHEVGVEVLDLRTCSAIYTKRHDAKVWELFPGVRRISDLLPMKFL